MFSFSVLSLHVHLLSSWHNVVDPDQGHILSHFFQSDLMMLMFSLMLNLLLNSRINNSLGKKKCTLLNLVRGNNTQILFFPSFLKFFFVPSK